MVPDISIIGVPKAGTTSLHAWLENLEQVNAAVPKETFYFVDPGFPLINKRNNFHEPKGHGYAEFFNRKSDGLTLDSTTHYLYQKTALAEFAKGSTRVLIVLRDPVKRIVSYFNYMKHVRSSIADAFELEDAVNALLSKEFASCEKWFSDEVDFGTMATFLEQGHYHTYIDSWQSELGADRIKVMLFEDFVASRNTFLNDVAKFFGLDVTPKDVESFEIQNESRAVKYPRFNKALRSFSGMLRSLPLFEVMRDKYHKLQAGDKVTFDWDANRDVINRLYEYYHPHNVLLSRQLNRDLSSWMQMELVK